VQGFCWILAIFLAPIIPRIGLYRLKYKAFFIIQDTLHTSIPWRAIRGMRNVVAHEYGNIDLETVWETSEAGIMELRDFCDEHIAANDFEITLL